MLRDKKGFTLVELIISMAVFVLVAGAIMVFMIRGINSYRYTKNEVDLQMQSQILMSQLNDMVRSSNYAVYDDSKNALVLYHTEEVVNTPDPAVADPDAENTISKEVQNIKIIYKVDNKLYLDEKDNPPNDYLSTYSFLSDEDKLMSDYISDFSAEVNGVGKSAVKIKMDMKNHERQYKTEITAQIRNRIIKPN